MHLPANVLAKANTSIIHIVSRPERLVRPARCRIREEFKKPCRINLLYKDIVSSVPLEL